MRKHLWIGFLIAGVCLYYAFRGISFRDLFVALSQAKIWPILLALCIYTIAYILRTVRWAVLLAPIHPIEIHRLFWITILGFFANSVLPLRIGELVRAHLCGEKFRISRTAALGTILLERLCDTVSLLIAFLAASFFNNIPPMMVKGAWALGGACLAAILGLLVIHRHEDKFRLLVNHCPLPAHWKERIQHHTTHFIHSISGITRPSFMAKAMALSLIIWLIEGTFLYLFAMALSTGLRYPGAFFTLFALGLSVTLPQAPGYVGTFELFGVTALALLGIPKSQGLPLILATHGTQFLYLSIMGGIGLWIEGLSFQSLTTTK